MKSFKNFNNYKMKIALMAPAIARYGENYYNIQVYGLAKELIRRGHMVDVYTSRYGFVSKEKKICVQRNRYFNVYYLPTLFPWKIHPYMPSLIPKLKKKRYDLIQTAEDNELTTLDICLSKTYLKSKIVLCQGPYEYTNRLQWHYIWLLFDNLFSNFISKRISYSIAKTRLAANFLKRKGYRKIRVIPVGIHCKYFNKKNKVKSRRKLNLKITDKVILYIGVFEERRNLKVLIKVIQSLVKKDKNIKLVLVGKGPQKKEIVRMVGLNDLTENVIFMDNIENKKLPQVYSAADVFVLLSKYEIFGMVILESMSCGTPVISTPTAGALDIIKDKQNGLIVPFSNLENVLGKKIKMLLSSNKLKEKLADSSINTAKSYDWKNLVEKYENLYLKVINEK